MQRNSVQTYFCNDTRISDLQFVNKCSAFLKKFILMIVVLNMCIPHYLNFLKSANICLGTNKINFK